MTFEPAFDLIVIGAGINGAGIARDAAMRGLKVLLLDKGDIGGGTSSASTRLIHGGLRYLEHGEIGLVRESLRERETLMKIARHLVRPLPLLFPIYHGAQRGTWTMRAGMLAYDLLSAGKRLSSHRMLSPAETIEHSPGLRSDGLRGAAFYFDAQAEFPERLVLENVLSAAEHGASIMNYAKVDKVLADEGKIRSVEFTTSSDTAPASDPERHSASARVVINAAGPWIDQLLAETWTGDSPRLIGGTKGSHLIVAPFAGAPKTAIYVEAATDDRPFFIIPWNGLYLIGTTDIPFSGDLDHVGIQADEIDYLIEETNRVIPSARLDRGKILYTHSGVRPLPYSGAQEASSITRRHFIRHHQCENLFSIVGGKLTTYRSLSEETVDLVCKRLGMNRPACATDRVPLPGAAEMDLNAFEQRFKQQNLPDSLRERWLRIYGTRAGELLSSIEDDPSLREVFDAETGAVAAEVVFSFKQELAQTLSDCLMRRTMVGLNSTRGLDAVEAAARIAQRSFGWTDERMKQEIASYRRESARYIAPATF